MDKTAERGLYKRGKFWYIHYYVNGIRRREATGTTNKQLAREILAKRRVESKEGIYFDVKKDNVTTLGEIARDFLEYSRNNKRSYIRDKQLVGHLVSFFGRDRCLNEITPHTIELYKNQRLNRDRRKYGTINRELGCLKAMFNWAIKCKKASQNPVREVKFFKENNVRTRYLTEDEIKRLVECCPPAFKAVVVAALTTGMRKSEILDLTWKDVDMEKGLIHVANTKNGRSRDIPICSFLSDTISECKKWSDGKYVFCSSRGEKYSKNTRTMFLRILEKAGIKDFRFHDLRHTAASYLVMEGVDLLTVKEILGHQKIEMTLRYAHLSPFHKKSAVEALGCRMSEATATKTATLEKVEKNTENFIIKKQLINEAFSQTRRGRLVV